nr:T9SS type A sorting domain-containing protein [Ignavibacteria bacterium]
PAGPSVTVLGSASLRFNWIDSSSNEDKFMIERSTNGGTNWVIRDSVAAGVVQYTDNGLTQNTQYCYRVFAKNCMGASAPTTQVCGTTTFVGVSQTGAEIPKVFNLYQNYPNPFNPVTNIKFDIPRESFVKITIYDALGRIVRDIVNQNMQPGSYSIDWNASSNASGIYFYRIQAGDYVNEMKMVLVK